MSVVTREYPDEGRNIGARPWGLDWWRITFAAAGLLVGGVLGARFGFEQGDPTTWEWFSPEFGTIVTTVGMVLGGGVIGLLLLIPDATRRLGGGVLVAVGFLLVGFPVGAALGPKWEPTQTLVGHVRVELTEPVAQVLEASATCGTLPNDGRVGTIDASPLGRVGIDELRLRLEWSAGPAAADTSARLVLRVNTGAGYEGTMRVVESGPDRRTGQGIFAGIDSLGGRIGGSPGTASGSISWNCTGGAVSTTAPGASPTEEINPLQGWFHLHGVVTVDDNIPGATPPFEGQASGTCSRAYEVRTGAIETVVTWVGGQRARLRLEPSPTAATLTVDLGDGSPPETVTAPATVRFLNASKTDRVLTAVFALRAGTLELAVDWFCKN